MRTAYQKLRNGDHLNDQELATSFDQFKLASEALIVLGPEFWIIQAECSRVADTLKSYIKARASHDIFG
jgi:hypothetical protein